jgi:hypothetical protein
VTKSNGGNGTLAGLVPQRRKSENERPMSNLQRGLRIHLKETPRNSRVSWKNGSHFASQLNAREIPISYRHPAGQAQMRQQQTPA